MNEDVFYSLYITNCVLNALSAYAAIMLNIVTIHAMGKTSSLPKPLKTLLLSLAVSDLGVGLVVQPCYIGLLIMWLQKNTESNSMKNTFYIVTNIFALASFCGVVALSVDRFLAIHLHLRYQELVTHKRVVAVVISIWMFSVFISLFGVFANRTSYEVVFNVIFSLCLISTTIVYYKIYVAVRRHTNQIQALQVHQESQNDEMTNFARLRKSAVVTFYVYIVFLICYLPGYCMIIAQFILPETSKTIVAFVLYSWTLMFFNSSLNPVIYCWKMRHIRQAIVDILRNILPSHS
ncbi:melanocortin receptor 5-like [Oculina patagonica]